MNVGNIVFNESPTNIEASIYPEFFFFTLVKNIYLKCQISVIFIQFLIHFNFTHHLMGQGNEKMNVSVENHLVINYTCLKRTIYK